MLLGSRVILVVLVTLAVLFVLTGVSTDTGGLVLTVLFTQIVVRRLFLG